MLGAVLFDWRGVLVHDQPDEWWIERALVRVGRQPMPAVVAVLRDALQTAAALPEIAEGERTCDCSAEQHRLWSLGWFALAGLDDELAAALYQLDFEAESHPFYPDVQPVFRALHEQGTRIAVVSDIHVDLRPEFVAAGLDDYVDAYVLSFEHGIQKPDPRIFGLALDAVAVAPADALMVGDRASHDGPAVAVGLPTLLLPKVASADVPVGLDRILRW